jgi:hypothetical protein
MKTPSDRDIAFVFMSEPSTLPALRWLVRLEFPAGSDSTSDLPIYATGENDAPIDAARLELAGQMIDIVSGKGSMKYTDFIKGKHSTPVWLYRKNQPPVPGGLTFM